jgi:UTP-glucose-1-phosphate uridylyltransferase
MRFVRKSRFMVMLFRASVSMRGEKLGYMMAQVEIALLHPEIGPAFKEYLRQLCRTLFTPP